MRKRDEADVEVIEVFHGFTWFHIVLQHFPQFGSLPCTSAKEYEPGDGTLWDIGEISTIPPKKNNLTNSYKFPIISYYFCFEGLASFGSSTPKLKLVPNFWKTMSDPAV